MLKGISHYIYPATAFIVEVAELLILCNQPNSVFLCVIAELNLALIQLPPISEKR